MPKLGKYSSILDCVFFLYKTKEDAEKGVNPQGSGFLVAVPFTQDPKAVHIHGITNWHVAVKYEPAPHIRINTHSGKPTIIDLDPSEWIYIEDGYDVVVSPPLSIDLLSHKVRFLDVNSYFLTQEEELKLEIGPADDVFMAGLFVDYFGNEVHSPAVRFGHISSMNAQVKQPTSYHGRSIMLDMNSRTGFSGSPVFVYRTLGSYFLENAQPGQLLMGWGHDMKLLGIHYAQFPEEWEIKNNATKSTSEKSSLITEGKYVLGFSGMTLIVPAAHILEVLWSSELMDMRNRENSITLLK